MKKSVVTRIRYTAMTGLIGFCLYRFRLPKQGGYQESFSEFMRVISDSMRSAV